MMSAQVYSQSSEVPLNSMSVKIYKMHQLHANPGICAYCDSQGKVCGVLLDDIKWTSKLAYRCKHHYDLVGHIEHYLLQPIETFERIKSSLWIKPRIFKNVIINAPYIMCAFMPNQGLHNNLVCAAPVNNPQRGLDVGDYRCDKHVGCSGYIKNMLLVGDLIYTNDATCEIPTRQSSLSNTKQSCQRKIKGVRCISFDDDMQNAIAPVKIDVLTTQLALPALPEEEIEHQIPKDGVSVDMQSQLPLTVDQTPIQPDIPPLVEQAHEQVCVNPDKSKSNDPSVAFKKLTFREINLDEEQKEYFIKFYEKKFKELQVKVDRLTLLYPRSSVIKVTEDEKDYEQIKSEILKLDQKIHKYLDVVRESNGALFGLYMLFPTATTSYFEIKRLGDLFGISHFL